MGDGEVTALAAMTMAPWPRSIIALQNNTRLAYPPAFALPTFVCDTAERCLDACVDDLGCGAMVWMSPAEVRYPVPTPGCAGQRRGVDGCCYPAAVLDHYDAVRPPAVATVGFVSAVVRTNASRPWPPSPPTTKAV